MIDEIGYLGTGTVPEPHGCPELWVIEGTRADNKPIVTPMPVSAEAEDESLG